MRNDTLIFNKRHGLFLVLVIGMCLPLGAQEKAPVRLSADEAVNMAMKNNLSLESARTNTATKKRASDLSWNQFIPNVTVAGTLMRDNEQGTVSGFYPVDLADVFNPLFGAINPLLQLPPEKVYGVYPYSFDLPEWRILGRVETTLDISAAMFENMKRLRLDYEGGLVSYEKAKAQLERDVRKAYHNILLLQENLALLRGSFENAGRQVQMAQANYNAGLAPELVYLQAQVARENMRPIIDQIENGLKLSMAQFAFYLGLDYDAAFELVPVTESVDFIPLDVAQMITKAASGKPDIQELRQAIMMMESGRKAQLLSLTPSMRLNWIYNPVFIKDPWKDPWFDSKDDWIDRGAFSVTLALRLHSLIPFSMDSQAIKNLEDQITTANIGLAQLVRGTEIEIYNTVLSLERTRTSAEAQAQTVSLAEQSFRMTEQAYQAGLQDYFQVQNAEQSLRQARVQMLEQQFNYLNGLIDLEYSIGVPYGTLSGRSK
ncbi:MAG: TolC family protein [Treponema sp.]|jgi:outer membrane protein TolC|nr:TolC family protein [Treponema sp.]